jgi:membrane protease YdiL (CAAX protease family)
MHLVQLAVAIGYLLAIGLAETVTLRTDPRWGFALYGLILLTLFFHAAFSRERRTRRLCLGLILVPLTRIVGLAVPLGAFHPLGRYLAVTLLLCVAAALTIHYIALRPGKIGLGLGEGLAGWRWLAHLAVALTGLPLGLVETHILKPAPLVDPPVAAHLGAAALALALLTGFLEELIFRGVLLRVCRDPLGNWTGVLYVSLLFGVLQLGLHPWPQVLLALAVNLFFGWVVLKTRTIYSVSVAHGFINAVVFLAPALWLAT